MREGDRPAWQGVSEASARKPGTPASRAKPSPRSAGVRSRLRIDHGPAPAALQRRGQGASQAQATNVEAVQWAT